MYLVLAKSPNTQRWKIVFSIFGFSISPTLITFSLSLYIYIIYGKLLKWLSGGLLGGYFVGGCGELSCMGNNFPICAVTSPHVHGSG